jgi:hypothetical protein
MSARMNWKATADRRRMHKQGAETVNGLTIGPAPEATPAAEPTTRRRTPQIAEPKIIDRWWKNRAHDAVYVRLAPFKEHTLIDIRVWVTSPTDGITRPGKGFCCTAKHLPRLHAALGKAMAEARALGLISDEAEQ